MEENDCFDFMKKEFAKVGYEGEIQYKWKSAASPNNGGKKEGCCVFWKTSRLRKCGKMFPIILPMQFKKENFCETCKKGKLPEVCETKEACKDEHVWKDNHIDPAKQVAMMVQLQNKQTLKTFYVVAAHLKSGEKKKDLPDKMDQAKFMSQVINKLSEAHPVIFGSDFNTNESTKAFKAFRKNTIDGGARLQNAYGEIQKHIARPVKSNGKPDMTILLTARYYRNQIRGHKEYATNYVVTASKRRPSGPQTDKLGDTDQTIDFIFHTSQFTTKRTLSIPSFLDMLESTNGGRIPNWKYPSDHFMIGVEVELL